MPFEGKPSDTIVPHAASVEEVLDFYDVNPSEGLSNEEVLEARKYAGFNELEKGESKSLLAMFLEQFDDSLVKILLASAALSAGISVFEEWQELSFSTFIEPIVILVILIFNAVVGVWQEFSAEQALEALKNLQAESAHVYREGKLVTVPARELVPGDVVLVRCRCSAG